jgi:hypothetical protein
MLFAQLLMVCVAWSIWVAGFSAASVRSPLLPHPTPRHLLCDPHPHSHPLRSQIGIQCTYGDALSHFKAAEELSPGFYLKNRLCIAKCCLATSVSWEQATSTRNKHSPGNEPHSEIDPDGNRPYPETRLASAFTGPSQNGPVRKYAAESHRGTLQDGFASRIDPRPPSPQDKVGAKEWLIKATSMRPEGPEEEASHAEAKKLLSSL